MSSGKEKTRRYAVTIYKKDVPNAAHELKYETMYYHDHVNRRDILEKYWSEGYMVKSIIEQDDKHKEFTKTY